MNDFAESGAPGFGVRFNRSARGGLAEACPAWATAMQKREWQERGVLLWQDDTRRLVCLSPESAVKYLEKLRSTSEWEVDGWSITRKVVIVRYPKSSRSGKKKKGVVQGQPNEPEPSQETVVKEIMRLSPEQARQFLPLLNEHEGELREMAAADARTLEAARQEFIKMLFRSKREREGSEFPWTGQRVKWTADEKHQRWICEMPPNRAIVARGFENLVWEVCLSGPRPREAGYRQFLRLDEAVEWAEEQLLNRDEGAPISEPQTDQVPQGLVRSQIDLAPYRIEASALEPAQKSFLVVLEVDAAPESWKVFNSPCGEQARYPDRYPTAGRFIGELQIDEATLAFDRAIDEDESWYMGRSMVTYYRESVAVEEARRIWNASRILEAFRQGKVLRGRYGVEEIETGYVAWLGECANRDNSWGPGKSREEYLASRAEELTIAHALDVDRFRELIGSDMIEFDDEWLVSAMHRRRVKSPAIPEAARIESERWLRKHPAVEERAWRFR